ncbi:MAG: DinB family protein, partial [Actinomycetota bacterium]|nr:DinB family protein [Actinomycetota bacterium]
VPGGNEDGSLLATLAHTVGAETVWMERWEGGDPSKLPGAGDFADLETIVGAWSEVEERRSRWMSRLSEARLREEVRYVSVRLGTLERFPLWQTILHLSNHTTHHRAEACTALSALGSPVETVDLIDFMRFLPTGGAGTGDPSSRNPQ